MSLRDRLANLPTGRVKVWVAALAAALAAVLGVLSGDKPPVTGDHQVQPGAGPLAVTSGAAVDYEGAPFESHAQGSEENGKAFPQRRIAYWIDTRGVTGIHPATTNEAVRAAFREAWANWSAGLDIEPVEVTAESDAQVKHRFGSIDGPKNTLAWSMLGDGTNRAKEQKFDTDETWTMGGPAPNQLSFVAVATHEIGHALGLAHDTSDPASIMWPSYRSQVLKPTPKDFTHCVGIGYKRRPARPPADDESDIGLSLNVKAKTLADALRAAGWEVNPPK